MRMLATLMLMVAIVTMTVSTASADFTRPPCPSQMRADNMCYATAVPVLVAETGKKGGGVCCDLFPAMMQFDASSPPLHMWQTVSVDGVSLFTGQYLWRPPRA